MQREREFTAKQIVGRQFKKRKLFYQYHLSTTSNIQAG